MGLIGCVYRSPNSKQHNSESLMQLLTRANNKSYSHITLVRDFNLKTVNWETFQATHSMNQNFVNAFQDLYWTQHVTEPTRERGEDIPSVLDLVLTKEQNMVESIDYCDPLEMSDHRLYISMPQQVTVQLS